MNSFLGQIPALIGVLIGAFATFITTSRTQRGAFLRESKARWDERRLSSYIEYARTLKASVSLAMRVAAYLGNDPFPHPLSFEDGASAMGAAVAARESAWESVLLLGRPVVVEAGRNWNQSVWEMETFIKSEERDVDKWAELWSAQDRFRTLFYSSARDDLGAA